MNVVHINTSDSGGAGYAALRLHEGLLKSESDVESSFLCLRKGNKKSNNIFYLEPNQITITSKVLNKIGFPTTQLQRNIRKLNKVGGKKGPFSFPTTDYDLADHPLVKQSDIVHLHWVSNFLDWTSFFKRVKKTIVWTLHDRNPFMGGFHLQVDKNRASSQLLELDSQLEEIKINALKKFNDIHIVTPSKALGELSKQSNIFRDYPHHHIQNSIDLNTFNIKSKSLCRNFFKIPTNKKVLLYASLSTSAYHKGFDLLVSSLKSLAWKNDLLIAVIGEEIEQLSGEQFTFIAKIKEKEKMAMLYNASDALVLPSREENLPNVMLEALGCGIPVISFPVGGMKEVIQHGFNGILVKEVSSIALSNAIESFINDTFAFDKEKIRGFAEKHFSLKSQAEQYVQVYKKVLNNL